MTAEALHRRIEAGTAPLILDVRSAREYRAGHVPGAVNLPYWRVLVGARPSAAVDDEVVVYCGHGPRAAMAVAALKRRGHRRLSLLEGHWAGWSQFMTSQVGAQRPSSQRT